MEKTVYGVEGVPDRLLVQFQTALVVKGLTCCWIVCMRIGTGKMVN